MKPTTVVLAWTVQGYLVVEPSELNATVQYLTDSYTFLTIKNAAKNRTLEVTRRPLITPPPLVGVISCARNFGRGFLNDPGPSSSISSTALAQ